MMFPVHSSMLLLSVSLLISSTDAFLPQTGNLSRRKGGINSSKPTRLPSSTRTSTQLYVNKRRDIFNWVKKTAVLGFGFRTLSSERVHAMEEQQQQQQQLPSANGKIVTFQVNNLNGEPGNKGIFKIQLAPEWAPRGVARFEELTDIGFWDDCRFFRVLPGFVVQFGINGNPAVQQKWRSSNLPDDPVRVSNERGTVVFATAGPNSRTTQLFVNTREQGNAFLDKQGFSPIGRVIEGMDVIDQMYAGYGEGAPAGKGPNQGLIQLKGNSYLRESFPKLTYIESANYE